MASWSLAQKPIRGTMLNRSHPLARGLELCLPMWEGTGGTVYDVSGNGKDAPLVLMDPATDWVAGPRGFALDFDGSDDRLQTDAGLESGNNFPRSVFVWVACDQFRDFQGVATQSVAEDFDNWILYVHGDATVGTFLAAHRRTTDTLTLGAPHCIGFSYDGDTLLTSIDGRIVRTDGGVTYTGNSPAPVAIGDFQTDAGAGSDFPFDGLIDSAMIYSRALAPDEIAHLYASPWAMFEGSRAALFGPPTGIARPRINAGLAHTTPLIRGGLVA